jgi:hypothetical protein
MEQELDENEDLYTDYALQIFSAFVDNNQITIAELMASYESSNGDDLTFMPGVIFGCMIHMGLLVATIAEQHNMSPQEAFERYALSYNTDTRKHLTKVSGLHPSVAKMVLEREISKLKFDF